MKTYPSFESLHLFVRVAEEGSFATVSAKLRIPKATLSRKISQLEQHLGSQLIVRTTRKLRLTEVGREFLQKAKTLLSVMEEAEHVARQEKQHELSGPLRITAGVEFGVSLLSPLLERFCERHPKIQLELDLTGRSVDLVFEGFDLAIRIGHLEDSASSARKLGSFNYGLFMSPKLLRNAKIRKPADLNKFPSLLFSRGDHREAWELIRGQETVSLHVKPRLLSNNHWVLKNAAVSGLGIVFMPRILAHQELKLGHLVNVLPEWSSAEISIHALYPAQRFVSLKVRSLIDFLAENLTLEPFKAHG